MTNVINTRSQFQYIKIYISDYLNTNNYYENVSLFYNNFLKDNDQVNIMIIYEDGIEYIVKTRLLSKHEALDYVKMILKKKD